MEGWPISNDDVRYVRNDERVLYKEVVMKHHKQRATKKLPSPKELDDQE